MVLLILMAMAVAPGVAIALYVYWKDTHDKEPVHLLVKCFFLGALMVIPAIILETVLDRAFPIQNHGFLVPEFWRAFMGVALVEEFCKFVVLRWYAYPKPQFNEPYDGITYSVMIGMGFATLENIMYVLMGGFSVGILRMFLAVPAHASFGILMGYFLGLAKFRQKSWILKWLGLLVATGFHGVYDWCLFQKVYPLLALGAVGSLGIALLLSRRAMRLHVAASPFNPAHKDLKQV